MYRPRAAVVPGLGTVTPSGEVSASEWNTAKSDITIISKRRYDIERFGTIGTADDGQTWADAYAQVEAWGGGTIAAPPGEFRFQTGFQVRDGVYTEFQGMGNTHLDFSGMATPVKGAAMYGTGSLAPLPALGANVAKDARTITFASAPALQSGDVFMLYNSTNSSFSTARAEYRAGEYFKVASVSGSTVTLTSPTYAAYTAGAHIQMYRLSPICTGISGARMTFKAGATGIRIALGTKMHFDELDLSGSNIGHIWLDRCYDANFSDVRAFDAQPAAGTNYGIQIGNSQRIRMRDCDLETTRHGLTTGGTNVTGCVPVRDVIISGGRISGMGSNGVLGVGIHGNSDDIHLNGVLLPNGVQPAGKSGSVKNCIIKSDTTGLAIYSAELLSPDWVFENNLIEATANHAGTAALVYIRIQDVTTVGNAAMRFANNVFDLGPYGWTNNNGSYVLRVEKVSSAAATTSTLDISDNLFITTRTVTANDYAIRQQTSDGHFGFSSILVRDNRNPHGMEIRQDGVPTPAWHFVGEGAGVPVRRAAKGSVYRRTDGGAGSTLYVNETGTTTWAAK